MEASSGSKHIFYISNFLLTNMFMFCLVTVSGTGDKESQGEHTHFSEQSVC